jgi:hypothetical protein
MELVERPGFEKNNENEIPEGHKAIVRERIKSAKSEKLISWKEARKQFVYNNSLPLDNR